MAVYLTTVEEIIRSMYDRAMCHVGCMKSCCDSSLKRGSQAKASRPGNDSSLYIVLMHGV